MRMERRQDSDKQREICAQAEQEHQQNQRKHTQGTSESKVAPVQGVRPPKEWAWWPHRSTGPDVSRPIQVCELDLKRLSCSLVLGGVHFTA